MLQDVHIRDIYLTKKEVLQMFGLVSANIKELSKEEKVRYNSIYCGICRQIREQCSSAARLGLSFDMAFLA